MTMISCREGVASALDENRFMDWLMSLGDATAGERRVIRGCPVARFLQHATGRGHTVTAAFTFDGKSYTQNPEWVREFVLAADRHATPTLKASECIAILDRIPSARLLVCA